MKRITIVATSAEDAKNQVLAHKDIEELTGGATCSSIDRTAWDEQGRGPIIEMSDTTAHVTVIKA